MKVDPYGITIAHTWYEAGVLMSAIDRFKVFTFVELGVHVGGLAALMLPYRHYKPGFRYLGIDNNISKVHPQAMHESGGSIVQRDCLTDECVFYVSAFISVNKRPAFIYCDDGEKISELPLYSRILRVGDIIGVHDYGDYPSAEISRDHCEFLSQIGFAQVMVDELEGTRIGLWRRNSD